MAVGSGNPLLAGLIEEAGLSNKEFARRLNVRAIAAGEAASYTHTSIKNWTVRGMQPRDAIVPFITNILGEALERPVTEAELGYASTSARPCPGASFPRDPAEALRGVADFWSTMDRREFLSVGTSAFAASAFTAPVTRWLTVAADPPVSGLAGRRIGRDDVNTLWHAAALARKQDSRFGGGDWRTSAIARTLRVQAAPMLRGSYSDEIGRGLFTAAAELSRAVGWSAVDMGHHHAAQRHLTHALRLARLAGDVQSGCYVLSTMALQAFLAGHPAEAADMAEGAYERARHEAAPRVLAFAKLAEARAHARLGPAHARDAGAALHQAETLLDQVRAEDDPPWLAYFTHARLAADAVEIHRDLAQPAAALRWSRQAGAMSKNDFTRAVGLRTAVVGATYMQAGELEEGLVNGHQAVDILASVESARARTYVADLLAAAGRWKRHPGIRELTLRANREMRVPLPV
ncbi:sporulation protein [Streptomyces hydrogenans]|uniref:sporulation protein n=1 Tax=Streptomyces hydrogenans TaxID=1873719 RepID=UPI0035D607A6